MNIFYMQECQDCLPCWIETCNDIINQNRVKYNSKSHDALGESRKLAGVLDSIINFVSSCEIYFEAEAYQFIFYSIKIK